MQASSSRLIDVSTPAGHTITGDTRATTSATIPTLRSQRDIRGSSPQFLRQQLRPACWLLARSLCSCQEHRAETPANFTLKLVRPGVGPAAELPPSSPVRRRHAGCSSRLGSPNVMRATAAPLRLRHAEPAAQLSVRSVRRTQMPVVLSCQEREPNAPLRLHQTQRLTPER